jgi:hypothetical protein
MTPLRDELHRILVDEAGYPPMAPGSLLRVLHAIGYTPEPSVMEIEAALDGLIRTGQIERVHSSRLGVRYRVLRHDGGDMSATT